MSSSTASSAGNTSSAGSSSGGSPTPPHPPRTKSQIEADLAATRSRLTSSVESLIDTVHPNRVKQRTVADVKQIARDQLEEARGLVFTARGDLRTQRVITVAGAVAGVVSFFLVLRAIGRRRG